MSTAALLARAVAAATDEAGDPADYWEVVDALHDAPPEEVWAQLSPLAQHEDLRVRLLVPDVLRHLGREAQPLATQTLALFQALLADAPPAQLVACIGEACVEFHDEAVVRMLAPFAGHEERAVREAVLHAVRRSAHPDAVAVLLSLSRDAEPELREWATFALGSQQPLVDSPEVREALAARLLDSHPGARDEAVVGLGLRGDARALGPLLATLERGFSGGPLFEAARALASPVLLEALGALQQDPGLGEDERAELAAAIAACRGDPRE